MIYNWYCHFAWLQMKTSSYPVSLCIAIQLGICVEDIELLWLNIYLTHTIMDSVWWLKKCWHLNSSALLLGENGAQSHHCDVRALSRVSVQERGREEGPTFVSSTFCMSIAGSCYTPCGFFWSQLWMLAYVSKGWEDWWLMGASFTELREMCILPFDIISTGWFLILSQNIEVEGFIDSRRLWYLAFCSCIMLIFGDDEKKGSCLYA